MTDQQLEDLGKQWPRLRYLDLSFADIDRFERSPPTHLTLGGIVRIASICHDLKYISVPFNATRNLEPTTFIDRKGIILMVLADYAIGNPKDVANFLVHSFSEIYMWLKTLSVDKSDEDTEGEAEWHDVQAKIDLTNRLRRAKKSSQGSESHDEEGLTRIQRFEQRLLDIEKRLEAYTRS